MKNVIKTPEVCLSLLIALMVGILFACCTPADNEDTNSSIPDTTERIVEIADPITKNTEPTETRETIAPKEEVPIKPLTEPTVEQTEPTNKPDATYKKVDEMVYATETVNIRSGPSTDHKKLGQLKRGDSVKRTGVGDNGWSRVQYNGHTAYIFTSYLSTTKPSGTTSGTGNSNAGSTGTTTGNYVGRADPSTGLSWDGVSPIIYTYPDGTTGTEPAVGATYESVPGIISTYTGYVVGSNATGSVNGVFYCEDCGKVCGDGSNGTCVSWLTGGNHTCTACGATVPGHTCHTCKEK